MYTYIYIHIQYKCMYTYAYIHTYKYTCIHSGGRLSAYSIQEKKLQLALQLAADLNVKIFQLESALKKVTTERDSAVAAKENMKLKIQVQTEQLKKVQGAVTAAEDLSAAMALDSIQTRAKAGLTPFESLSHAVVGSGAGGVGVAIGGGGGAIAQSDYKAAGKPCQVQTVRKWGHLRRGKIVARAVGRPRKSVANYRAKIRKQRDVLKLLKQGTSQLSISERFSKLIDDAGYMYDKNSRGKRVLSVHAGLCAQGMRSEDGVSYSKMPSAISKVWAMTLGPLDDAVHSKAVACSDSYSIAAQKAMAHVDKDLVDALTSIDDPNRILSAYLMLDGSSKNGRNWNVKPLTSVRLNGHILQESLNPDEAVSKKAQQMGERTVSSLKEQIGLEGMSRFTGCTTDVFGKGEGKAVMAACDNAAIELSSRDGKRLHVPSKLVSRKNIIFKMIVIIILLHSSPKYHIIIWMAVIDFREY